MKSVAALMAQAELDEDTPAGWRLLFAELLRLAQAVHDAYLARSESEQAGRLADEARKALDEAKAHLGAMEALRDELSEVFEVAQEKAVAKEAVRRRQKGQVGLRPEQFVALMRRPAPEESPAAARRKPKGRVHSQPYEAGH